MHLTSADAGNVSRYTYSVMSDKRQFSKSFGDLIRSLNYAIQSAYNLAPFAVICMSLVALVVILVAIHLSPLMYIVVLLIVFLVALIIYISSRDYGQAALALAAGLLSVYSVQWSKWTFISFVVVWLGFSFIALLISSIRLSATLQDIYVHAATFASPNEHEWKNFEIKLRQIGKHNARDYLSPVDRAEVIRYFVFRKVPIELIASGLKAVGQLASVTKMKPLEIASFIANLSKAVEKAQNLHDVVKSAVSNIRESAVPPKDYLAGFEASRHLIFELGINPKILFSKLRSALESGIRPEKAGEYLQNYLSRS